jgi:hypothetical protein
MDQLLLHPSKALAASVEQLMQLLPDAPKLPPVAVDDQANNLGRHSWPF